MAPRHCPFRNFAKEVLDTLGPGNTRSVNNHKWQGLKNGVHEDPLAVAQIAHLIHGLAVGGASLEGHESLEERRGSDGGAVVRLHEGLIDLVVAELLHGFSLLPARVEGDEVAAGGGEGREEWGIIGHGRLDWGYAAIVLTHDAAEGSGGWFFGVGGVEGLLGGDVHRAGCERFAVDQGVVEIREVFVDL